MRVLSLVLLCLMACSLTACANKTQQRRQQYERATADLQNSVAELNQRLATLEQSMAAANTDLSVLKNHPYPVKTTKGSKTNYMASAPSMAVPQPLPASPAPRAAAKTPMAPPLMAPTATATPPTMTPAATATPTAPAQPQGGGWLSSFADPPPPPPSRGTGAKAVPASAVQGPRPLLPQDAQQAAPVAQTRRPAAANELSLPPETPVPAAQAAIMPPPPPPPVAPQAVPPPASRGGRQTPAPAAASGQSEDALYNKALGEFNASRYSQAAAGFTELMHTYPTGRYAPNAGYWLGEALYGQNQYSDALAQFKEVTSRFPQHHKAPDALLKAGLCYMRLGDRDNAALQFRALATEYPGSPAANLARQRGYVR